MNKGSYNSTGCQDDNNDGRVCESSGGKTGTRRKQKEDGKADGRGRRRKRGDAERCSKTALFVR